MTAIGLHRNCFGKGISFDVPRVAKEASASVQKVRKISKKFLKAVTFTKSCLSLATRAVKGFQVPKGVNTGLKQLKFLKLLEFPALVKGVFTSKTAFSTMMAVSKLYMFTIDIREAVQTFVPLQLIPGAELPFTVVVGLGNIALFAVAVKRYYNLKQDEALLPYQSQKAVEKYLVNLREAKYDMLIAGCDAVWSIAFTAGFFIPGVQEFLVIYYVAKGIGSAISLLQPFLP